jgi:hypothetical protein
LRTLFYGAAARLRSYTAKTQTGSQADKIAVMHNTAQSTRVTYAVVIVKAGKVGAEMQGLARRNRE